MKSVDEYIKKKEKELHSEILQCCNYGMIIPHICIIQIGNDINSLTESSSLMHMCENIGLKVTLYHFKNNSNEKKIIKLIKKCNKDNNIHGIIIQNPVPEQYDLNNLVNIITDQKNISITSSVIGIKKYLETCRLPFLNKNILLITDNNELKTSVISQFNMENNNIILLNSLIKELDLKYYIPKADVIIISVKEKNFLKKSYNYKKTAIIIDAGAYYDNDSKELIQNCESNINVQNQELVNKLNNLSIIEKLFFLYKKQQ